MTAVGIDFGTSNSVVAQWAGFGDDPVEVLALDAHHLDAEWNRRGFEFLFPSVVGLSSLRSGLLFGWEAKLRSEEAAEVCKRLLKSDEYVTIAGRRCSATTVAAAVFQAMREGAERNLAEINSAVVTVPANATGAARYRTRAAARYAGITVQALLNEPTAAAISYAHDLRENSQILVFDWGGGTIDVTVLDYDHRMGFFEERASRGVTELGGIELDRRLRSMVLERTTTRGPWSPSQERQFALDIERAKIRLSTEASVAVITPAGEAITIRQSEFEAAIEDLIDRALVPIRKCLEALHMAPRDVDAVLMIGGTSQIPSVRSAVAEVMQTEPVSTELCDPMTVVGRGAAIAAAMLNGETDGQISVSTSHALGTMVTDRSGRKSFSRIVPRHAVLPVSESKSYTPKRDYASELHIEIWEGNPDQALSHPENVQLATLKLAYRQPGLRDESRFRLKYSYDVSGILRVQAELEATGEVVLDEEISDFSAGGATTQVRQELETLRAVRPVLLPPVAVVSDSSAQVPRPRPVAPRQGPVATSAVGTVASEPLPDGHREVIVVDGSNLAWIGRSPREKGVYERDDRPSYTQLLTARDKLAARFPDAVIHVIVDATFRHKVDVSERAAVEEALSCGDLIQPPPGTEGKADALVAAIGDEMNAVVVTNDNYIELQHRHPWLCERGRVRGATLVGGEWLFEPRVCVRPRQRS